MEKNSVKVLLVNPPNTNIIRGSLPPVIEDDTGAYPPLGLLYIAAFARTVEGCDVYVLDCQAENITHEEFGAKLIEMDPDVIGVQVMTFTLIDSVIVAKTAKKVLPDAYVVFGGPHATIFQKETARLPHVDAVIPGEGEYVFAALIKAMQKKEQPETVKGVLTKEKMSESIQWDYISNLDQLQMPARDLVNIKKYTSPLAKINPITTIMSSRGCPAKCIFCDRPQMGKHFRKRSALNVVDEMDYCNREFGIGEFVFYDDTFTIDNRRVFDICDMILKRHLKIFWDIRARVDTVTEEMVNKLRDAGCHRIHYGVETGSPRIQKRLRKNLNLNKIHQVFSFTKKVGIQTLGYFMIGCPDEELEDMKQTFELMQMLPMDYVHVSVFTPYPGTQIYIDAVNSGFYEKDYWRQFALDPLVSFEPKHWNQHFSDEELLVYLKKAYSRFYGRPSYLFKSLLKVRSCDELIRKIVLGAKLLRSTYH